MKTANGRSWWLGSVLGVVLVAGCSSQAVDPLDPNTSQPSPGVPLARGGGGGGGGGGGTPASPLVIATTPLPNGNVGTFYGNFITSSGGQGTPHEFRIIAGRLPSGLTMAKSFGVQSTSITGTPTRVETTSFTVQVQDQTGHSATATFSLTIDPARPLVITNQSSTLAPGTFGTAYAIGLFADGGVQPYTWAIVAGQLPPGLSLTTSPGRVTGTPTTGGTFTFTARVTDSGGQQASREFSITVS